MFLGSVSHTLVTNARCATVVVPPVAARTRGPTHPRHEMRTQLQFLGAADTVTGSRYLTQTESSRVLVDCGLFQGYKVLAQGTAPRSR